MFSKTFTLIYTTLRLWCSSEWSLPGCGSNGLQLFRTLCMAEILDEEVNKLNVLINYVSADVYISSSLRQ